MDSILLRLVEDAQALDVRLQEWANNFPNAKVIERPTLAPKPGSWSEADYHPPTVDHFEGPGNTAIWILYFATRMLVKSTCLSVFNLRAHLPADGPSLVEEQRQECSQQLHLLGDRMASAVAAFSQLGKAGKKATSVRRPPDSKGEEPPTIGAKTSVAGLIIWPLAVAASVDGLEPGQQQWFRAEIARIGKAIGNGFFELAAPCPEWTILGRTRSYSPTL